MAGVEGLSFSFRPQVTCELGGTDRSPSRTRSSCTHFGPGALLGQRFYEMGVFFSKFYCHQRQYQWVFFLRGYQRVPLRAVARTSTSA